MEFFKPVKPMKYPRADGTIMTQIQLYDMITNPTLDLRPLALVVEPIVKGAQCKLQEQSFIPEIVIIRT